ncbi:MAG: DUF3667 domain-containing protein [Phenylobacterium sp.]|uniref:DUF3667 domain-containing protein n=1 Tax=Phenylobacterium sp. TaxID=1871053 RepID=UPI00273578F6|nr:DUF3667 domain-containing protein [Phenylobacterium sp.]MDP3748693.1 DUF3667 domain-containing protein [Phenylobacterium sp.]
MDLDAVGGAATGGLIGAAIEKPTGLAGEHAKTCTDCGAEVSGRFCQTCGQPTHVHRTLLHLGEELLHGVMHFDSRIWRTLPLLVFNPGKLTREWVYGKRTRYVSPLATFLFTVFVMFMLLSFMPVKAELPVDMALQRTALANRLAADQASLVAAEAALAKAPTGDDGDARGRRKDLEGDVKDARDVVADTQEAVAALDSTPTSVIGGRGWEDEVRAKTLSGEFKVDTGNKDLDKKLRKKLENPALALYKLQQTFYKFSFLLVPISLPFVALLFIWKRGFTFYDHGVLVLYSLTFMAMLTMVAAAIVRWGGAAGGAAVAIGLPLIIPAHMFAQLKGAYSLRMFSAIWRTFLLLNFCVIAIVIFLLTVIMLGFTG